MTAGPELSPASARAVLRRLDPRLRLAGLTPLVGGSTAVWRLDLQGGQPPLVLKVYPDTPDWAPAKEAWVAGVLARHCDLPLPMWRAVDDSRDLLAQRYALTTAIEGVTVRSLLTRDDLAALFQEMGQWLRRLHEVPMPAYGYVLADGVSDPRGDNLSYMEAAMAFAFGFFRSRGGEAQLARDLESKARDHLPAAAVSPGPRFAHDDFQPGNLLARPRADGGWRLSGLIDFGNARAADPLFDLAKTLMCCDHEDPRIRAPLLEGYGSLDHPEPETALWLYLLHHRLVMWAWLAQGASGAGPIELLKDLAAML